MSASNNAVNVGEFRDPPLERRIASHLACPRGRQDRNVVNRSDAVEVSHYQRQQSEFLDKLSQAVRMATAYLKNGDVALISGTRASSG